MRISVFVDQHFEAEQSSATLLDEYQLAVSSWWTRNRNPCFFADLSVMPTAAKADTVNATVGTGTFSNLTVISFQ